MLSLDRLADIGRHMAANGGQLGPNYNLVNNLRRRFDHIQHAAAERLQRTDWTCRTFHDLRRSYGTVMAHHVPMHELKALMGHSSIKTTERHYLLAGDVSEKVAQAFAPKAAIAS